MIDRKLKIVFGFLSVFLLTTLFFKMSDFSGGVILPGFILGGILLLGVLIGCLILAGILKLIFKKNSFLTLLSITTTIGFSLFHYYLYSPTLTIIVPKGFNGEINLVLSNVNDNILAVDNNGIGYINKWTFDKANARPIVKDTDGNNIDKNLIGFAPSTFWGISQTWCANGQKIQSIRFAIASDSITGQEVYYYNKNLENLVDKKLVLNTNPD